MMKRIGIWILAAAMPAQAEIVHQYTFNKGNAEDSSGTAHGALVAPAGERFSRGSLDLSGNDGQDSRNPEAGAYLDLPNGIISAAAASGTKGALSIETWVTVSEHRTWAEIWCFGTSRGGEDAAPGASGSEYITLIARDGKNGKVRLASRNRANQEAVIDAYAPLALGQRYYIAAVFDQSRGLPGVASLYINGVLVSHSAVASGLDLTRFVNNNNWLGRSQWPDPLFDGIYHEVTIHNTALSPAEVRAAQAAGPR